MSVVIIQPSGELKMDTISQYKSYGSLQHTWKTLTHEIQLYGKKKGKPGHENKYEFPPPIENIFYGSCLLVNPSCDFTIEMWNDFYESMIQPEIVEEEELQEFNGLDELEEEPYKIDLNDS
jgi:hypothetical protein